MREDWEIKKLGEICESVSNINWKKISVDTKFPYIDLSAVDRDNSKICEYECINKDNAPSRAKQIVNTGDVIFATTRPLLKRVCVITKPFNHAIASTGFCVLRPTGKVVSKWIYYKLKSDSFYKYIKPLQKGISYPAVTDNEVKNFTIPVPPLSEQEHIVEELDLLSGVIEKKREQLKELDNLAQSIFYDMFGDPITNEKDWEVKKLGEVFQISSGGTPNTKNPEFWDNGTYSWIGSNMCQNEILYHNDGKYITETGLNNSSAKEYSKGFVLVALVGATIGKVGLLKFNTTTNQNIAGIDVPSNKQYTPEFVFYLMQNLYDLFLQIGGDKFKMANLSFVRDLPIITPPLPLQQEFAEKIEAIEKQKELIKQSLNDVQTLFNSRMDYYFSEE